MASKKIEELTKDLAELDSIIDQLKRPRNQDLITVQKKRIETELIQLREQERVEAEAAKGNDGGSKPTPATSESKRYECTITNYAWDQSDKFVKFFICLNGVQNAGEDNVKITLTPNSVLLNVSNLENKDHKFTVNNLLHEINVDQSYRKVKTDSVVIYAKKAKEGQNWSHLTATEKRLADIKKSSMSDYDMESNKDDPSSGLMKIMQRMYETGDPEMKRMISKAWTEGQEKNLKDQMRL